MHVIVETQKRKERVEKKDIEPTTIHTILFEVKGVCLNVVIQSTRSRNNRYLSNKVFKYLHCLRRENERE